MFLGFDLGHHTNVLNKKRMAMIKAEKARIF
jgi:hypothetical protein